MPDIFISGAVLTIAGDYKPGDQAPAGYLDWHEWAEVQHKAGLRQKECGRCGKWKYPQELSDQWDEAEMQSRKGPVTVITPVCNKCMDKVQGTMKKPESISERKS